MKFPLKLLLVLCAVIAGIYAAVPLWLPHIFANQLPPGWQLESLETDYLGLSGIHIKSVSVSGDIQAAGLAVTATDINFRYQGLKTEVSALSVDIFMQDSRTSAATTLTLDDLSLPITSLTGKFPELSISESQLTLHPGKNADPSSPSAVQPVVLSLQSFKLIPDRNNDFQFSASVGVKDFPGIIGQLKVNVSANTHKAGLRFPAATDLPAWLEISLEQSDTAQHTTTQVHTVFDTPAGDQNQLNEILARLTAGQLSQIDGSFVADIDFAGKELQSIKRLTLATEDLRVEMDTGSVNMNVVLDAERNGERISVSLPHTAEIQLLDTKGTINELISLAFPELQRSSDLPTNVHASLSANSSFNVRVGPILAMQYKGDLNVDVSSGDFRAGLKSTETQIDISDFSRLHTAKAQGLITLSWEENQPITFTSDDLEFSASKQVIAITGQLDIDDQVMALRQVSNFELQLEGLQTRLQTDTSESPVWLELMADQYTMQGHLEFDLSTSRSEMSPNFYFDGPVTATHLMTRLPDKTIEVYEMAITTKLTSTEGTLVSTGKGRLNDASIMPPPTSVSEIDMSWQNLDLLKLTGKLQTRTSGFTTEFEDDTWTGFDFDIHYELNENAEVSGSASVLFESGPTLPIGFTGNYGTEIWSIDLQPTTIQLAQMGELLGVAHVELPDSIDLTEGSIDLRGDVLVDDEITANMAIQGHELAASMLESSASKAGFNFNARYGNSISASGPLSIEAVALAGGIDVTHISAELNLEDTETLGLRDLYAETFDGEVKLTELRVTDGKIEKTSVELNHINLQGLLAYADIDGLDGTGFLDVSLPIGSDQIGIYVKDGTFSSIDPGHLAYTEEGVASSNIGLQALQNFQYSDLSGTIDYQSNGVYMIKVRLEGKNPDLYGGHPIVFNLNIDGSLPEVFEAMFITGNFEESILNQIKANEP